MGILDMFRKRRQPNHFFEDEDRRISLERRRANAELSALRQHHELLEEQKRHELEMLQVQQEINSLREEVQGGSSVEDALAMHLIGLIGVPKAAPPATSPVLEPIELSYPDEQLRVILDSLPEEARRMIPASSDQQIKDFVKSKVLPKADADTLERCVDIAREGR